MIRIGIRTCQLVFLLLSAAFTSSGVAQESKDFSGDWTLRIGKRIFVAGAVTATPESTAHFTGSLVRLQHFSSSDGGSFSNIKGPVIHYPIVRGAVRENCLFFTTQNPADKTDEDDFQLCIAGPGSGTLKFLPGAEPWPVTREKGPSIVDTDWDSARTYFLDDSDVSGSEMQRIFERDQKDRQPGMEKIDWTVVNKADAARREATAQLLANGKLHTGEDFERAAFVFQHGDRPDDYLLAHTLAIVAVSRGRRSALWIASATMDRYLNSIHQPQIYGTQFSIQPHKPTTQEPYNRVLVSDALRRFLGVPSQAAQEEQRKQYDSERSQP